MLKVGLTGNIGSGKTTVAQVFAQLGVPVYNSDERAKQLMTEDLKLVTALKSLLGEEAYFDDGKLNRPYISSRIFSNHVLVQQVNALVHPAVFRDFDAWVEKQITPYIIKEAALLYESGSNRNLNKMIVVSAPNELRIQRALKRDRTSREAIIIRMKNQMSQTEKEKLADYILLNDETELLLPQVLKLHEEFSKPR